MLLLLLNVVVDVADHPRRSKSGDYPGRLVRYEVNQRPTDAAARSYLDLLCRPRVLGITINTSAARDSARAPPSVPSPHRRNTPRT